MPKKKAWQKYIGFGIGIALLLSLIWYIRSIDTADFFMLGERLGYAFFPLLLASVGVYFFGTLAWYYSFQNEEQKRLKLWRLFVIRTIGENITLINPTNFIGGEAYKIHLLNREGFSSASGLSSIIISRTLMITMQVLLFVIIAIYFMFDRMSIETDLVWLIVLSVLFMVLIAIALVFLLRLKISPDSKLQKYSWLNKFSLVLKKSAVLLRKKRKDVADFTRVIIFSTLHWLMEAMEIYALFYILGYSIGYDEALLMDMGIIIIKSFAPIVPGQLGVEEYGNKIMMHIIGIQATSIWLVFTLFRRVRQIIWILIGLLFQAIFYTRSTNDKQLEGIIHHT